MTLEMPFKDTIDTPQPATGWSPARTLRFGAAIVEPIVRLLPDLRDPHAGAAKRQRTAE
jgi:murein tripeptide amidase MpaA